MENFNTPPHLHDRVDHTFSDLIENLNVRLLLQDTILYYGFINPNSGSFLCKSYYLTQEEKSSLTDKSSFSNFFLNIEGVEEFASKAALNFSQPEEPSDTE
jgi:hypothetical protein